MFLSIEELCIHEWALFSERVEQENQQKVHRGMIDQLLTNRPDKRRPLTWERNHVDLLLMEDKEFICPWTEKRITKGTKYDLDHLLPLSLYPINELWNLVPADPDFNSHKKRDRLPQPEKLQQAKPHLELAYRQYGTSESLKTALKSDAALRFSTLSGEVFSTALANAVVNLIDIVGESRNIARF
ncbi:HNH endonuclease domain-containing protein [Capilliphycus salinus ALCB114379]|uniref:HNH endonuclease domain-containing protein n=1 Tax=Capilliphycus salinus TaxID=2768948 RepID=UPI0039A75728